MNTKVIKLNGGGILLLTRVKDVNGVDVEFRFNGGAINDPKNKLGIAHFAEHALCEFTTQRYSVDERLKLRRKFTMTNGGTSYYMMRLVCAANKNMLDEAFDFVLSPISEIIYNQKDFDWQYDIIKSEIITHKQFNNWEANKVYQTNIIADKRVRHLTSSPAGDVESLGRIKLQDIKSYIKNYVTLNNLTISICGDVSEKRAKELVNKYVYKYIPTSNVQGIVYKDLEGLTKPNFYFRPAVEKDQANVHFAFNIKPYRDFDFKLDATKAVLTKMLHTMAFNYFRGENALCYRCQEFLDREAKIFQNTLTFDVEEKNVEKILEEMPKYIAKNSELDRELFDTIKNTIINTFNFDRDPINYINRQAIGRYLGDDLIYGDKLKKKIRKHLQAVTYEDANNLYKECFKGNPYLIIVSNDDKWKDFDYKTYCKKFKK